MCDIVGKAYQLSRRGLFRNAGEMALASAALSLAGCAGNDDASEPLGVFTAEAARGYRTRLVILGTAGGPPWELDRAGIASAVVVNDAVYVVDCGEGVWQQYRRAGLSSGPNYVDTLTELRGVFLTHLHSDHLVDYFNLWLLGFGNGLLGRAEPVQVFGPGDRGSLPPLFGPPPAPPIINPSNPTPGIVATSRMLLDAYAADMNDRMRDVRIPDMRSLIVPHDIPLPPDVIATANTNPSPRMTPIDVYEDSNVKVTATLVDHRPTFPSFGYRFDTENGSIVFSGDTTASPNLIELARGADILVHEVMDPEWTETLFPPPRTPTQDAIVAHILASHTTIEQVGRLAEEAQVGTLVLSHLIPGFNPKRRWREAEQYFSGKLIVGEDLMQIGVGSRHVLTAPRGRTVTLG